MENVWKVLIAAALAALGAYIRQLAVPLVVLGVVMIMDWISGVAAAWENGTLNSRIGIMGIIKKLGYLLIVVVGMALDYIIHIMAAEFGQDLQKTYYVGLVITIWLIINECISILENTDEMGVPVPPFVAAMLRRLKRHTEDIANEGERADDIRPYELTGTEELAVEDAGPYEHDTAGDGSSPQEALNGEENDEW